MKSSRSYSMSARAGHVVATRDRIVASAVELFMQRRFDDVTLAEIATAAGVSHQTVLNHFESKEGVAFAAAEVIAAATDQARGVPPVGNPAALVRVLVNDYELIGDANVQWVMDAERLGSLSTFLDRARRSHAEWLETAFAAELPEDPKARRTVLMAVYAATDVYTWKLLRRDFGLSKAQTERIMLHLVRGALRPD